ncbi:LOW QUALITY PROTEIN: uncharacterized protein LOC133848062 [Drosophila sulfurigaster albostrigata]|uniref:LOW QUALITY PROTEIN: uncharacterized protein LOC133848062 n=1 Tax=Drosophila sulfurigaster albostrigata TaxID=89887 RepID=UPI002D21995B|nr:LOW QUALITY PROTEIN: uncharacterized protein LOC133848062 [Drosophila sulfurigaster albostrigata]
MNGLANNNDDSVECPLCMEPLEVDDLTFFPCTCGYQICRFCWHRIRTDENKLCPACRKEYPENPADFKPLTQEEMIAFKSQKRQRDQQRKQKITENRKHLANVRVVQKNLVFVVGLPPRLADADILKKHEYFGKYGKIHKVVINPSTTYAGVQGPSASAYVTYVHNTDALRAIQSVNNIMIDGRLIKTSLGTTKYCSHFMKNQQCPKGDCMYLHELGDSEASFTKEEMHQGKHQEYEKRLHDLLIATSGANSVSGIGGSTTNGTTTTASASGTTKANAATTMSSSSSSSTSSVSIANTASSANSQQKEAWPSLSVSPVNSKETLASACNGSGASSGKSKKEKFRNEKTRHEKNKSKSKQNAATFTNSNASSNKENFIPESRGNSSASASASSSASASTAAAPVEDAVLPVATKAEENAPPSNRGKTERNRANNRSTAAKESKDAKETNQTQNTKQLEHSEESSNTNKDTSNSTPKASSELVGSKAFPLPKRASPNAHRSHSSSSEENSDDHISESSASGKSSPGDFKESQSSSSNVEGLTEIPINNSNNNNSPIESGVFVNTDDALSSTANTDNIQITGDASESSRNTDEATRTPQEEAEIPNPGENDCEKEVTDALSKLNMFDDSNSFFSSSPAFQQSLLLKNKVEGDMRPPQVTSSHLPDLLNGIDGYQKPTNTNEWEEVFKNVMIRNNRQVDEQVLHQQHLQLQQQHHHQQVLQQQEEFLRIHDLHKRNNMVNTMGMAHPNGPHPDFPSHFHGNTVDGSRPAHGPVPQQHLLQQPDENQLNVNNLFGGNMSKFFDFHKSQQQLHQQYINGHSMLNNADSHRLAVFLENSRVNPSLFDNGMLNQQAQVQKQRLMGAFDKISPNQQQNTQSPQNRFSQTSLVDDDLGFDPFTETQKGLAELMENEVVQQNVNIGNVGPKMPPPPQQQQQQQQQTQAQHHQLLDNMQRARMPPPGFNHMNALGFDGAARVHSSKILPFINMPGNGLGNNSAPLEQQQHPMQMPTNWESPFGSYAAPTATTAATTTRTGNWRFSFASDTTSTCSGRSCCCCRCCCKQPQQRQALLYLLLLIIHSKLYNHRYSSSDWTSMDPAILSFRQFSSFPHQAQMPLHQQQQDLFLQHLAQNQQQQQQQNGQGFSNQSQQMLPGMNMPNNLMNGQSSSQTQVNANVQGMLEFLKNRQFFSNNV